MTFFRAMSRHLATGALRELTLTTNGSQLRRFAGELADCGVRRVNVSLDTLDPEKFARITRWGRFAQVMDGIDAAVEAGLRVKINTVALKGVNEDELARAWSPGAASAASTSPSSRSCRWAISATRTGSTSTGRSTTCAAGSRRRWTLADTAERTGGPARYVRVAETGGRIGFITPLTHNFCESCNRVRLTCTGQLFMCLGQEDEADLRSALRANPADDAPVAGGDRRGDRAQAHGHDFDYSRREVHGRVSRHMSHTGG